MAQPPKPPYIDGPATPTQKTSLLNTSSGRSRTYSQSFQVNKHSSGVSLRGGIVTEAGAGYGTLGQRDKVGYCIVEKGEHKGKIWSRTGYGGLRRSSTIAGGNGEGRGNKYLGTWGRRRICVLAGVLLLGTGIILSLTREDYQESQVSTTSLSSSSYDFVNQRTSTTPDKNGYIRLVTLPFTLESPVPPSAPLTPSKPKPNGTRRLILVGDVHGAFDELKALLEKVDFDPTSGADHLVLTGDVVAKGPKSGEVLDFMNKLGEDGAGSCVRGNHDDRVLKAYERLHKINFLAEEGGQEEEDNFTEQDTEDVDPNEEIHGNTIQDMENNSQLSKKGSRRRQRKRASDDAVAKTLKYSQAKYLATCPLILRVRSAGHNGGDLLVVHAGIVPGIPLLKQNPELLMNMRTILPPKHAKGKEEAVESSFEIGRGSSTTKGRHWASVWNEWENARVKGELGVEESSEPQVQRGLEGGRSTEKDIIAMPDEEGEIDTQVRGGKGVTVVYGHYAAKGLDIRKWTKGLDSNCVRGGRLSALVVQKGVGKGEVDMQIVSVKCKKYVD